MQERETLALVLRALKTVLTLRESGVRKALDQATALLGPGAVLDSLGLVQLVVEIEQELAGRGVNVSLTDEKAMSQRTSPFLTAGSLAAFIEKRSREKK